jgi:hypothetical protein
MTGARLGFEPGFEHISDTCNAESRLLKGLAIYLYTILGLYASVHFCQ